MEPMDLRLFWKQINDCGLMSPVTDSATWTEPQRALYQREQLRMVRRLLWNTEPLSGPFMEKQIALPAWRYKDLRVIAGIEPKERGELWYHVSYSRPNRIPDHTDTCMVRAAMFKPTALVVAVFPPVEEYINLHPFCLHLWQRLDPADRLIPDLRVTEGKLVTI